MLHPASLPRSARLAAPALFALTAFAGCCSTEAARRSPFEVEVIRNVAYHDGPDADARRHRLDLYRPKGHSGYPVVMLVHGGAWMMGDKSCCGFYAAVGEFLAGEGIGAVLPNYRLSPGVKHPEHVRDVARAFAWAHAHIADYGGRPDQMFLAGHSAGGHLVALLGTDESHLRAEGLSHGDVKGVIAVCGVYRIPPGALEVTLGGSSLLAFRFSQTASVKGGSPGCAGPPEGPGLSLSLNVFGPAFGDDPLVRAAASPVTHVRPGLPPFLILTSERDLPTLPGMAREFHQALLSQGCEAWHVVVRDRNHNSIMFRATRPDDPTARMIVEFIRMKTEAGG